MIFVYSASSAIAGEQGHYNPMSIGARDYVMPPKGFYLLGYNTYYGSDTFKDSGAKKLGSLSVSGSRTEYIHVGGETIPITITGNLNIDLDFSLDVFSQVLTFVWVPGVQILGADYAMIIIPSWASVSVEIKAKSDSSGTITVGDITRTLPSRNSTVTIRDSNTGFGDLYVQPIWLAWRDKHYDISVSYGVYAPTGFYDKDNIANIGMGFLTQQVQANAYYYPFENQATAFRVTPTYEWHSKKIDKAVQPGQTMTLEYGISQFINPRAEIAVLGYSQWEITTDVGHAVADKNVFGMVSGIGTEVECWVVEDKCAIVGRFNKEYWAKDRFEGIAWSVNIKWVF